MIQLKISLQLGIGHVRLGNMAMTRGNMRKQISKPPAKKKKPKMLKKGGDPKIPAKYLAGLSSTEKAKRKKENARPTPAHGCSSARKSPSCET